MGEELLFGSLGGAVAGFVFQSLTTLREQSHQRQIQLLELAFTRIEKEDVSADKATSRDGNGGIWMRRFILAMLAFSLCIGCFVFAFFDDIPIIVERVEDCGGWLWGIIPEYKATRFERVQGYYIPSEFKTAFMSLIFFYFGRSAGK